MNQLEATAQEIVRLRNLINEHRHQFVNNETQTRSDLVNPMLRILGWTVGEPAEVEQEAPIEIEYEDGVGMKKADYVLKDRDSGLELVIVEAKALGGLLSEAIEQVEEYCVEKDVGRGVVTDGDAWILLDVQENEAEDGDSVWSDDGDEYGYEEDDDENKPLTRQIARFSITYGDAVINAILAQQFGNETLVSFDELQRHWSTMARALEGAGKVTPVVADKPNLSHLQTMASLLGEKVPPEPTCVSFPDGFGVRLPAPEWRDWVAFVAMYLYQWRVDDDGELEEYELPVALPRSRSYYIVNDEPEHKNESEFDDEIEVAEDIFIELDLRGRSGSEVVCAMLEACYVDPASVLVGFD